MKKYDRRPVACLQVAKSYLLSFSLVASRLDSDQGMMISKEFVQSKRVIKTVWDIPNETTGRSSATPGKVNDSVRGLLKFDKRNRRSHRANLAVV